MYVLVIFAFLHLVSIRNSVFCTASAKNDVPDEHALLQVQVDVEEGNPLLLDLSEKYRTELTALRSHLDLAMRVFDGRGESDRLSYSTPTADEISALVAEAHVLHSRLSDVLDATTSNRLNHSIVSTISNNSLLVKKQAENPWPPILGKRAARSYQSRSTTMSGNAPSLLEEDPVPWPDILGQGKTAKTRGSSTAEAGDPNDLTDPWPSMDDATEGDETTQDSGWTSTSGNFSNPPASGDVYIKGNKHGSPWIIVLLLTLFVMMIGSLVVIVSPMHVDEQGKVSRTKQLGATPSTGIRSRFANVVLPFWVPTPPDSYGLSFTSYFLSTICTGASLCFWIAYISILIGRALMPFAVSSKAGTVGHGWLGSLPLRIITLIGIPAMPLVAVARWKDFKGRLPQWGYLTMIVFLVLLKNVWHVASTFVVRIWMDAMMFSDAEIFWKCYWVQCAGLVFDAIILMLSTYLKAILALRWREYMTHHFLDLYLCRRSYYAIDAFGREGEKIDNPDQRIQEDANYVATNLVLFVMDLLNSFVGLISFATMLWTLKPTLTLVAVGYSLFGSFVALLIAWKLVIINYITQRSEADFRFSLVHVRNNPEAIAFYGGEAREKKINTKRFEVVVNMIRRKIRWDTVGAGFSSFFSTLVTILPPCLLFSDYFRGELDFGALMQAGTAFAQMMISLSFVVSNLQNISSLSTAANRLGSLLTLLRRPEEASEIEIANASDARLQVSDLTASIPGLGKYVVRGLSLQCNAGGMEPMRLLLVGPSGVGKSSLLRVVAGLWKSGRGTVKRPPNAECLFLPQKPYMPLGDLRTQLIYPDEQEEPVEVPSSAPSMPGVKRYSDAELHTLLTSVGLGELPDRLPEGFGGVCDWSRVLSVGEQQRLASLRIFLRQPKLTILDEATSALSPPDEARFYERLMGASLSYVSVGHRDSLIRYHERVLELRSGGEWKTYTAKEYADVQARQQL